MFSKLATTVLVALVGLSGLHVGVQAFECSGVYGVAKCCAVNVLGVVSLDCVPYLPTIGECSSIGKTNQCCIVSLANQAVACQYPGV